LDDFSLLELEFPAALTSVRPLTYLTYWFNFALGPAEPWAFRLTNIAIHVLAVQLCFGALRLLLDSKHALWAALLYALHPLQSEAVLYIFARPVLLMGALLWAALHQWLRGRFAPSLILYLLALGAKEEAVFFPVLLLLLYLTRGQHRAARPALAIAFALAVAAGLSGLWNAATIAGSGAGLEAGITPLRYFATQLSSFGLYALRFVYPAAIVFDNSPSPLPSAFAWLWLAPAAALAWKRHTPIALCLAAAWIALAPTSSILPLADLSADRRMYLAVPCLAAAWLPPRPLRYALSVYFAAFTLFHSSQWRSPQTLWVRSYAHTHTLRPALELARLVPDEEAAAILESRRAIGEADPNFHTELGRLALSRNDAASALRHFGKALALDPDRASHYYNRGVTLHALGQADAAREDFARALRIDPKHRLAQQAIQAK
jgi:tetratricopeptide (TPR) repeat protein